MIIKSVVETGTPFAFNRDHVNRANPNSHKGIIYCSNLCTEIAQNMSEMEVTEEKITEIDGEQVVVTVTSRENLLYVILQVSLLEGSMSITGKSCQRSRRRQCARWTMSSI